MVFDSKDENKEVLQKSKELWNKIENEIETINCGRKGEYGEDFMKIKIKHLLTIIVFLKKMVNSILSFI